MSGLDDATVAVEEVPSPGAGLAVHVRGLTKVYGSLRAVDSLDLDVPVGSVFGIIGPNGAGKSTTFSVLASLLLPTSGHVRVLGRDPVDEADEVRTVMGYMPDVLGVYDNVRVDEYLRFFAGAYRIPKAGWNDLIGGLLELVDLTGKRDAMVNSLSRGMKQRLSLARALVHDPQLLILDEPASGLDPRARVDLRVLLQELQSMGKTIVISSHILPELQEVCTDVAIMEAGRLLASGSPRSILDQVGAGRKVRVRYADGSTEEHRVVGPAEQAALLRRLVTAGEREVVEFTELGGDLEDLFLSITQGVVQ
jgi:ABC-2 type transport system ATP-binding protein